MINVLRHIASGDATFSGALLIVIAVVLASRLTRIRTRVVGLCTTIGGALVVGSAPAAFQGASIACAASCLALAVLLAIDRPRLRHLARILAGAIAIVVALIEADVRLAQPSVPVLDAARARGERPVLLVIGDSLSAGLDEGWHPWPETAEMRALFDVQNLAVAGDTVELALSRLPEELPHDVTVIVEIGGNDMLGGTPVVEFEHALDALLARLAHPTRDVVLLELPLLPMHEGFGRAQRRLARLHRASLIPKRLLARVVLDDALTSDGLHLSERGATELACRIIDAL